MTSIEVILFSLLLILLVEVQIVAVFSVLSYLQSRPTSERVWTPSQADIDILEAEERARGGREDLSPLKYSEYVERFEEIMKQ